MSDNRGCYPIRYEKLGMKYKLDGVKPIDKKALNKLTKTLNNT